MEIDGSESILKKLRLDQLEPSLRKEVLELALEMGQETTLVATSDLHFLFRVYQAEKAKDERSREMLRKAENLILKLSSLHHDIVRREEVRRRQEQRGTLGKIEEFGVPVGERAKALMESIGIKDQKVMEGAVALFGEEMIVNRVELVHSSKVEPELMKSIFSQYGSIFLIPKESDFAHEIEMIEFRKDTIDNWVAVNKKNPPLWADYKVTAGILLDDLHDISRQLSIAAQEEEKPAESIKPKSVRIPPMKKRDLHLTLGELGYNFKRKEKELIFERSDGFILTISDPHNGEYSPETIKKIINDMGIYPAEFEEARKRALGVK